MTDGRDPKGRFIEGNRFGRGNPWLAKIRDYRAAIRAAVTPERLKTVFDRLIVLAQEGDVRAAQYY